MKLFLVLAFVATLMYGCATHYAAHETDDSGRYGYQQPHSYYESPYDYPNGAERNYYPNGFRYFNGG